MPGPRQVTSKATPSDFSLLDPAVQECPYHAYKVYRECPAFQMPETGHFVVSRYEDIYYIVRTPEIFSMDTVQDGGHPYDNNPVIKKLFSDKGWESRTVLASDPPLHSSYRKLLEHCFTNKRLASVHVPLPTDFGTEFGVCAHTYTDTGKVNKLMRESMGRPTNNLITRTETVENAWSILYA